MDYCKCGYCKKRSERNRLSLAKNLEGIKINKDYQTRKTSQSNRCLKIVDGLLLNLFSIAETFKKYYSSLTENFVLKLPKPPKNFRMESVNNYCEKYNLKEKLILANTQSDKYSKYLKTLMNLKPQVSMFSQEYF